MGRVRTIFSRNSSIPPFRFSVPKEDNKSKSCDLASDVVRPLSSVLCYDCRNDKGQSARNTSEKWPVTGQEGQRSEISHPLCPVSCLPLRPVMFRAPAWHVPRAASCHRVVRHVSAAAGCNGWRKRGRERPAALCSLHAADRTND